MMKIALIAVLPLVAASAAAHDFWIEPSTFEPRHGELVRLQLKVGEPFEGESFPRDPSHLRRFFVQSQRNIADVPGREGADPAGWIRYDEQRPMLIAYEGHPQTATLTPERFAQYIEEDGLETKVTPRDVDVSDLYSRSAKTIVGGNADDDQALGLTLELIAGQRQGDTRSFQLLFEGKPLQESTVFAVSGKNPEQAQRGVTDANGSVRFSITDDGGPWLIKTVHIEQTGERDYRSYWSSLMTR